MIKEWFSHDCGTRNDPDMIPLLEDFKAAGYGIYWSTVELMHERGGSLPLNENTFKAIGKPISAKSDLVGQVINKCIDTYNLFFKDQESFTSERVHRNLSVRQKVTVQRSNAGKASATARQRSLNETPTVVEQPLNEIQQSKESKVKKVSKDISEPQAANQISFKDLTSEQFGKALETYKHDFERNILRDFFNYWREPSPSGKMRFQLEKTWDLGLRLNRWKSKQEAKLPGSLLPTDVDAELEKREKQNEKLKEKYA